MQNEQLIFKNMHNYEIYQLKTNPTASFAKSTDTDAKPTTTDTKPTVMHLIIARRRANRYQEKSYPEENVTCVYYGVFSPREKSEKQEKS